MLKALSGFWVMLPRSNHKASLFMIQTVFGWASSSQEFIKALKEPTIFNNQKLE
jgi:hypothetical protein